MDLFDWDQFDEPNNTDISNIIASALPFESPASPLPTQRPSSSNVRGLEDAEYETTQFNGSTRHNDVLVDGSHGPTSSQLVDQSPPLLSGTRHSHMSGPAPVHSEVTPGRGNVSSGSATPCRQNSGSGVRLSQDSVQILRTWLQDNALNPYPSELEKQELKRKTGLRKEQISNWLANARRRGKVPQALPSIRNSALSSYFNTPNGSSPISIPGRAGVQSFQDMSPLARWRNSPPEHEGAAVCAISNAVSSTSVEHRILFSNDYAQQPPQDDDLGFSGYRTRSVSSIDTNGSSGSDFSQVSQLSGQILVFHRTGSSRRRRKKGLTRMKAAMDDTSRPYQCTFCTDRFKTKYDWQRHEKTFHLSLESWRCAPQGPSQDGGVTCAFCGQPDTSSEHFDNHGYASCAEQPALARTFFRKDHLRQHLRLFHKECAYHASTMDSWVTYDYEVRSRCGFCDSGLANWPERVDHLAAHFKEGKRIEEWKGGTGFEPHIEGLIENAIPISIIASEMNTVDPFSASSVSHRRTATLNPDSTIGYSSPGQMDWLCLDDHLDAYVKGQLAVNQVPTDQEIQVQGRIFAYGLDDPWNQTRADIPSWMESFKQRVGLRSHPSIPGKNVYVGFEDEGPMAGYFGPN